jgi:Fe-S-cluster containining protein
MVMPAIATRTYKLFEKDSSFRKLIKRMTTKLARMNDPIKRAHFVHQKIDNEIKEQFKNPSVQTLVQCKKGCSACCHSQVAITEGEAKILAQRINEGAEFNYERLNLQAKAGNSTSAFFQMSFEDRACAFLTDRGLCSVYEDRPSVCRTNYVLSDPKNCEIRAGENPTVQLLNTFSADSWVYSLFRLGEKNGALAPSLLQVLEDEKKQIKRAFPWSSPDKDTNS